MSSVRRALVLAFLAAPLLIRADTQAGFARVFDLAGLGPRLLHFSDEKTSRDLALGGPVVYYFAATWCPDCREDYEDLKANLYRLPASLTVVFVDFDNAGELKRRYGVPVQNVFVQIDARGDRVKRWVGGGSAALIRNLVHPGA